MSKINEGPSLIPDEFFTTPSGKQVNISELLRISIAVSERARPGMSEAEIDRLVADTVKRMSPN